MKANSCKMEYRRLKIIYQIPSVSSSKGRPTCSTSSLACLMS